MKTFITVMSFIAGALFALSGFLATIGHIQLAAQYLEAGLSITLVTIPIILVDAAHKFLNHRYVRRSSLESPTNQPTAPIIKGERLALGIIWDSALNQFCPVCKTPLTLSRDNLIYRIDGGVPLPKPILHCMKCNKSFPLYDDDGNHITLSEAKKLLSPKTLASEVESLLSLKIPKLKTAEPPQPQKATETNATPQQHPPAEARPDKTAAKILDFILKRPHIYVVEIGNALRLEQEAVKSRLAELEKLDYVHVTHDTLKDMDSCVVTQKGKDYLNKPRYAIPFPSGHDLLDPPKIEILKLLAHPESTPLLSFFAQVLNLSPIRTQDHLDVLLEHGYITGNTWNEWNERQYSLTRKARKYLIENNLVE